MRDRRAARELRALEGFRAHKKSSALRNNSVGGSSGRAESPRSSWWRP